ncbi:unnamed protein product [Miscanthus lutarioriparius]|uniref:Uncharacterized protein n=1 Tax=Miscanthus lutarioriparius TaxID=422564 RepID=A0A811PGG2_9POAL|nr:unnamed protein product [Miscanthus lutarioriparius]
MAVEAAVAVAAGAATRRSVAIFLSDGSTTTADAPKEGRELIKSTNRVFWKERMSNTNEHQGRTGEGARPLSGGGGLVRLGRSGGGGREGSPGLVLPRRPKRGLGAPGRECGDGGGAGGGPRQESLCVRAWRVEAADCADCWERPIRPSPSPNVPGPTAPALPVAPTNPTG